MKIVHKKIILFLAMIIPLGYEMDAQNYFLGYQYGLSWNSVKSDGNQTGAAQTNFSTGVTFDVVTRKKLRFGAELLYEKRGFNLGYTVILSNFDERSITNYHHQHYLSIPLKVGYQVGNQFYGFGAVGVVPAFTLKSTFTYPKTDNAFNTTGEITEKEQLEIKPFDLGALIDLGVGYSLTEKISILSSIRIQRSVFEFSKDYQMTHRATTLFLTLRYRL